MAYTDYAYTKPVGTDAGTQFASDVLANFKALLDMIVSGMAHDWDLHEVNGSDKAKPTDIIYRYRTDNNQWLRVTLTFDGNDNLTVEVFERSTDGGSNYDEIGTRTFTYDGDQNLTGWTWS